MFFYGYICAGRSGCGAGGNTYTIADGNAGPFRYGDTNSITITKSEAYAESNADCDAKKIAFADTHPNSVVAGSYADAVAGRIAQPVPNTADPVHGLGSARASDVAHGYAVNESGNGAKTVAIAGSSGLAGAG